MSIATKERVLGWLDKETTSKDHVIATLGYADLACSRGWPFSSYFCFPYIKEIEGKKFHVAIRKDVGILHPKYNIDIGTFTNGKEWYQFESWGWFDFDMYIELMDKFSRSADAYISREIYGTDISVHRPIENVRDHFALFVKPEIRRHGVATFLVNAARVLLARNVVETLIIKGIDHTEGTHPIGKFYGSLNPSYQDLSPWRDFIDKKEGIGGRVVLPTRETQENPYKFE